MTLVDHNGTLGGMSGEKLALHQKSKRRDLATGRLVDPERRRICNEMLARPDVTKGDICRVLKMDRRTVDAICAEDMPEIAEAKIRIARMAYESTVYNLASAAKKAKKGNGSALEAKLSWDVYMGAMGEATSIVQVNHEFPALSEFLGNSGTTIIDV